MDHFDCPECNAHIPFQFGSDRDSISHLYGPGCERCPTGYRHAQLAEARRRRHARTLDYSERNCAECTNPFVPETGIGKQPSTMVRCQACRKPKIRKCPCCGDPLKKSKRFCETESARRKAESQRKGREREVARTTKRAAERLESSQAPCTACGDLWDTRIASRRKEPSTMCSPCHQKVRQRLDSRLRSFKDQLLTTLFPATDPLNLDRVQELLKRPCMYCQGTEEITIEHIKPLIQGGTNTVDNLGPACRSCNCARVEVTP